VQLWEQLWVLVLELLWAQLSVQLWEQLWVLVLELLSVC
jgi:hypothetical protein